MASEGPAGPAGRALPSAAATKGYSVVSAALVPFFLAFQCETTSRTAVQAIDHCRSAVGQPTRRPPAAEPLSCGLACLLQASIWEHTAVLSNSQQQAIDVIGAACSQRAMPKQVSMRPSKCRPSLSAAPGTSEFSACTPPLPLSHYPAPPWPCASRPAAGSGARRRRA